MACAFRQAFALSYGLALLASVLTLCGLAAVQNLCHTGGLSITIAGDSIITYPGSTGSCATTFRFQWWGWVLQIVFLATLGAQWAGKCKHTPGTLAIGATSVALDMIFANETLRASSGLNGAAFSRNTLLFIGWILSATATYIVFLTFAPEQAACGASACNGAAAAAAPAAPKKAAEAAAAAGPDVEVAAASA